MRQFNLFLLLLLFSLFFAACGSSNEAVVTPPIAATDTAVSTTEPTSPEIAEPIAELATVTAVPVEEPTAIPTLATSDPALISEINLELIVDGLNSPVYLTHANDDRLFVAEQYGAIRIIETGVLLETPFLEITDRVGDNKNEQGLLGVAFHPDYAQNGRFFVNYTNNQGNTVIARFNVSDDPNRADPDSERILLTIEQPYNNHNGGQVAFGPDGYLYIGMGDGGDQNDPDGNGQNAKTLLGTLLRIDVNVADDAQPAYAIPADNPYVNDQNGRNEIWATGLRNPWRFSFDRQTGDLFISDVGQDKWEEISLQPAKSTGGENYGWNILEGNACFAEENCDSSATILPIFDYDHSFGCSITGGYIYRGTQYPELTGNYFTADFCTGFLWALFAQEDGTWASELIAETELNPTSFGEDANGELYILSRSGEIYQMTP